MSTLGTRTSTARRKQKLCQMTSRQAINEFRHSVGGVVAHDTIPGEGERLHLLREAGLVEALVQDEPDRYLAVAHRKRGGCK